MAFTNLMKSIRDAFWCLLGDDDDDDDTISNESVDVEVIIDMSAATAMQLATLGKQNVPVQSSDRSPGFLTPPPTYEYGTQHGTDLKAANVENNEPSARRQVKPIDVLEMKSFAAIVDIIPLPVELPVASAAAQRYGTPVAANNFVAQPSGRGKSTQQYLEQSNASQPGKYRCAPMKTYGSTTLPDMQQKLSALGEPLSVPTIQHSPELDRQEPPTYELFPPMPPAYTAMPENVLGAQGPEETGGVPDSANAGLSGQHVISQSSMPMLP